MSKEKGPYAKDFLTKQSYDKRERGNKWGKVGGLQVQKVGMVGRILGEVAGMTWAREEYDVMSWEVRVSFHVGYSPTRF